MRWRRTHHPHSHRLSRGLQACAEVQSGHGKPRARLGRWRAMDGGVAGAGEPLSQWNAMRAPTSLAAALCRQSENGHAKAQPLRGKAHRAALKHNAAFCKVAPFTTLVPRCVRWGDRFAPCGFAERGVMSGAPQRLPSCLVRCAQVMHTMRAPLSLAVALCRQSVGTKRTATTNPTSSPCLTTGPVCSRSASTAVKSALRGVV